MLKIIFIFLVVSSVEAQNLPQFTHYFLNNYLVNPAAGGTKPYLDAKMSHRRQWSGLAGAPITYTASLNGYIKEYGIHRKLTLPDHYHSLGGHLLADQTGIFQRFSGYLSYAYHLTVYKKENNFLRASIGAAAGLISNGIDYQEVVLANPNDKLIINAQRTLAPDLDMGVWLYSNDFYIGLSATQLLKARILFNEHLQTHFYLTGGYKFHLKDNFALVPSIMFKAAGNYKQLDINLLARYSDMFWGGFSYRIKDAFALLVGCNLNATFDLTYSYDFSTHTLRNATHEVTIGFKINNAHRHYSDKKIPIYE